MSLTREQIRDGWVQQLVPSSAEPMRALSEEELRRSRERSLAGHPPGGDLAVFAYGSLIWNPAFHFAGARDRAHPRLSSPLLPVDQSRPRHARAARV